MSSRKHAIQKVAKYLREVREENLKKIQQEEATRKKRIVKPVNIRFNNEPELKRLIYLTSTVRPISNVLRIYQDGRKINTKTFNPHGGDVYIVTSTF